MEIFFGSFIKELIAVIVALFMPFSTVAAVGQADQPKGVKPFNDRSTVCTEVYDNTDPDDGMDFDAGDEQQEVTPAPEIDNE